MSFSLDDLVGPPPTPPKKELWTPADGPQSAPVVNRYLDKPLWEQPAHIMKLWRLDPIVWFEDVVELKLDPWQEDVVELYRTNQRLGLVASKGPGKAQPLDSEIYTPKGKRRFGDLKVGDQVFSEYGTPTKVTAIHPQGEVDTYRVTFDDGTSTECCKDHLWKVHGFLKGRTKKWGVLSTQQILDRGLYVKQGKQTHHHFQLPRQGKVKFPHKRLPIDPYLLGLWLGDGSRTSGHIACADTEIIERLKGKGHIVSSHRNTKRCPTHSVKGLLPKLRKLELLAKYSYEKSIPETYKTSSILQRTELLKGLMDADGTVDKRDACTEFSTTSKNLALDVQFLIRSLGGKSTLRTRRSFLNGKEHRTCYRVRVSVDFNPFSLARKSQYWKAPSQARYLTRTIKNIEPVGKKESMCISVECENRCYLTNDFIVTHNTFIISGLGMHFFSTKHLPKVAALSITKDHLLSNLWAELLKMRMRSKTLQRSMTDGATKIGMIGHEGYCFIDARSFPKQADEQAMASPLAGLHADNVAFLIDEGGMIPDSIFATADAALSTEVSDRTDSKILATGNPEVAKGTLYRASVGRTHQKWAMYHVSGDPDDPKRAPRVSIDWAREQIKTYGKDDPWVLVNVYGKYPPTGANTLLSEEEVYQAMNRNIEEKHVKNSQHRLGVDVARGGIDRTVFARRRGLKAYPLEAIPSNIYGPELAGKVAFLQQDVGVERVFVDNTGGYGSSVIDSLQLFPNIDVTPVVYNAKAQDARFFNKRTEMWVRLRDWVKKGGCLPNDPMLAEELTTPRLIFHAGVTRLEEKEQIKVRLGRSPDRGDALAQTFADVESASFYADFGSPRPEGAPPPPVWEIMEMDRARRQPSYLCDESQIDKYHSPGNYKA